MIRRADILAVGTVGVAENGLPELQGWHMGEADQPGWWHGAPGRLSGWTVDELRVVSVLWIAYRFPLPIPGDQFGPVPDWSSA